MADNPINLNNIESHYLKARIEAIQANPVLDENKKLHQLLFAIRQYIIVTVLLRTILSVFTLFTIWPIYNAWASKKGLESRWFTLKEGEALDEVSAVVAEKSEEKSEVFAEEPEVPSEVDVESPEQAEVPDKVKTVVVVQPEQSLDVEVVAPQLAVEVVPVSAVVDPVEVELKEPLNSAVKTFTNITHDQRKFKSWYAPDTTNLLLNMPKNWSQCIRVLFDDGGENTLTFATQISSLILLSKEFHRPALFIAKEPGASIHYIAGLYFKNTLLFMNPMGCTPEQIRENDGLQMTLMLIKEQNPDIKVVFSTTIIQHDPEVERLEQTVSCGPIVSEFSLNIVTQKTRQQVEAFLNNLESEFVDISPFLPESLVELVDEKNSNIYEKKVVSIRSKHLKLLCNIPPKKNTEKYLSELNNPASQVVFNYMVLINGHPKDLDIRDSYNKLALEIGCAAKRDHLTYLNSVEECNFQKLAKLGSGSAAITYKYEAKNETQAIKRFKKLNNPNFRKEADILFSIHHENVIHYLYSCTYKGNQFDYIALEYAELGDLGSLMKSSKKFPPLWAIKFQLSTDIGSGLSYLHDTAKIIHRDLKVSNVLVTWNAGRMVAKINDFDLSTSLSNYKEETVGTALYVAPEVYAKFYPDLPKDPEIEPQYHTVKSDVYAYGVILWEIATWSHIAEHGHNSWKSYGSTILKGKRLENPEDVKHPGLATLVAQCWKNRFQERPSAQEALQTVSDLTC